MTVFEDRARVGEGLFDAVRAGLVLYDAVDEVVLDGNRAFRQLSGFERETLQGTEMKTLIADDGSNDGETVADFLQQANESGASVTFDTAIETPDGTVVHVVVDAVPDPGEAEDVLLLTVRDDTRRRALKQRAREYRDLVDETMRVGDLGWWEMDVDSGAVRSHPNKVEMLDFDPGGFDHYTDFTELLHPDDYEPTMDAMRELLEGDADLYDIEYRIETADGEYRWYHDVGHVTGWTEEGDPAVVTGIAIDITERRETEQKLRDQREELALLNRLIHHDIRNDMTIVNLCLEILRREFEEHLNRATAASQHTIDLTDSVREVVDVVTEDGEMEREPVHLGRVLEPEVERVRRTFEDARVSLVGDETDVLVAANPMLSSVFGNLLNNAVHHNDKSTPTVLVEVVDEGTTVVVRVADDGPGIPDDLKERIFERGTLSLTSEGSGLGLYIVHKLVSAYGGEVWVTDNEPEGAVVGVRLQKADGESDEE
ncbi:sensor histidine kinase [Haloarchaeobius amylolyticus]|uniref:sensor histidine kinase n=1 Tax=Haloarchaeobius amylolyticus TaxID=1198296 RepID=UPI0022721D04|nr:ATP-binding protein [Haloarchaeobius amylolyticus]